MTNLRTYAQTHPERVSELILRGVCTVTQTEIDWYYQFGVSEMFPDKWAAFQAPIPEVERHDMVAAYHRRLMGGQPCCPAGSGKGMDDMGRGSHHPSTRSCLIGSLQRGHFALAFARLENHFFTHKAWLEGGQMLANADRLKGIPGVIVHGRYDMPCAGAA